MVTTVLCLLGAAVFIGICQYAATGDDRELNNINKDLEKLNNNILAANASLEHFQNIILKLDKSIEYLEGAQNDFKNGGCFHSGNIPFANDEYNDCLEKLRSASTNVAQVKIQQQENINEWQKNIKEREARKIAVEKLIAQRDAVMIDASKNQHAIRDGALDTTKTSKSIITKNKHR